MGGSWQTAELAGVDEPFRLNGKFKLCYNAVFLSCYFNDTREMCEFCEL